MATATLPAYWEGRSGRRYVPAKGARVRHGGLAVVRKVVGRAGPVGTSTVAEGVPLALKLWHEGDESSLDQLQAEARILVELSSSPGELPCPRLYDLVGNPLVTGLVMEWCPADLERWWREKLSEPDAFGRLMAALGEAARRCADYHEYYSQSRGLETAHGDLKPANILLSSDGRWLISDFGAARFRQLEDSVWESTRAVVGTENFIAPEVLFNANKPFAGSVDTWALSATVFALLRLQRMVLDGGPVPRNGTHSPRFRMARMNQVIEVFGRDPTRFRDRDLDAEAFPEPLKVPDEDRRAVVECLRGCFGAEDPQRERQLADKLLEVLDRGMSIDPVHRYTSARDLALAFDELTRTYIGLAATVQGVHPADVDIIDTEEALRARDDALRRNRALQDELSQVRKNLAELEADLAYIQDQPTRVRSTEPAPARAAEPVPQVSQAPRWWGIVLVLLLLMQLVTMLITVIGVLLPLFV